MQDRKVRSNSPIERSLTGKSVSASHVKRWERQADAA